MKFPTCSMRVRAPTKVNVSWIAMPRTRGGLSDDRGLAVGASGGRRTSKGRNHLDLDLGTLDEGCQEYTKDDFEINEMVLGRHPEHNEAWWPVKLFSQSRKAKSFLQPQTPHTLLKLCLGLYKAWPARLERIIVKRLRTHILAIFDSGGKDAFPEQGIILDPRTEVPDHVRRQKQRETSLCIMFYGSSSQARLHFRYMLPSQAVV